MTVSNEQVLQALKAVQDPDLKRDIVSLGFIKHLTIEGGRIGFTIELTTPACPVRDVLKEEARAAVAALPGVTRVNVTMTSQVRPSPAAAGHRLIPTIKHVVPIASGKGGVGKSTVAANVALALAQMGARVGLMDADVYGPSVPTMLGVTSSPAVDARNNRITPVVHQQLKIISMGFFIKPDEAVVWRGPMLHKTMEQFLGGVDWGELDYLIIDLPPGTGDVQLSLCQMIPITGAVVVSTPQDVALNVAQKAIEMFKKLKVPVLGIIENMSGYRCPHCGTPDEIFGSGGARLAAERLQIPFLGAIPLATTIRAASDAGQAVVLAATESPESRAFRDAASQLAAQVSIRTMQERVAPEVKVTF